MVNDQFKTFSINLNAQHVNGMTPFDLAVHMYGYKILCRSKTKIEFWDESRKKYRLSHNRIWTLESDQMISRNCQSHMSNFVKTSVAKAAGKKSAAYPIGFC